MSITDVRVQVPPRAPSMKLHFSLVKRVEMQLFFIIKTIRQQAFTPPELAGLFKIIRHDAQPINVVYDCGSLNGEKIVKL